jgi:hypothetical protein
MKWWKQALSSKTWALCSFLLALTRNCLENWRSKFPPPDRWSFGIIFYGFHYYGLPYFLSLKAVLTVQTTKSHLSSVCMQHVPPKTVSPPSKLHITVTITTILLPRFPT